MLLHNSNDELHLSKESLPFIQSRGVTLNAYILDFFKHGQRSALTRYNWIHENVAYTVLEDFRLILATIATSLKLFTENLPNSDPVSLAFTSLSEKFNDIFFAAFENRYSR